MITVVDLGIGNVAAFVNLYSRLHISVRVARNSTELQTSEKLILPGVGSFDNFMDRLDELEMRETLNELVLDKKIPILGVCVGMQVLADSSDEGSRNGLGWIPGNVRMLKIHDLPHKLKIPHMGWNYPIPVSESPLFSELDEESRFYFLHSYYFDAKSVSDVVAEVFYGGIFPCAVNYKNIYGVQFHPEKSHQYGERLLKNFAEL